MTTLPTTIEAALEKEGNVINQVSYGIATAKLCDELWEHRDRVEALVRHHMALGKQDKCIVLSPDHWIRGGFNVCVMVDVLSKSSSRRVVFRCPMPHKLAELKYPGSVDEKLSCEVGAHAWIEAKCPEIRTPHLFGFGLLDGRHFTHATHMPILPRVVRYCWHLIHDLLGLPLLSYYIYNQPEQQLHSAYMLLEYLGSETGRMLSDTFDIYRGDGARRRRLFQGVSRTMLSLARIPQMRIGSFRFNQNGTVTLTNRPLSCSMMILENDDGTRTVQKDETFGCTDAYVSDMLAFHDQRFLSQPNAVYSEDDCREQMAVKTLLRVLSRDFIKRELRNGPFPLQLTDFHASNILVDEQWNVTGLIDLEWICALPSEMVTVPYWVTGCAIDTIEGESFKHFDVVRQEFMEIFRKEEQATKAPPSHYINLSKIMQDMWKSKGVWFWYCLSSVNAMYFLLRAHLVPPTFLSSEAERVLSTFWSRNSEEVVRMKLAHRGEYEKELRQLFHDG